MTFSHYAATAIVPTLSRIVLCVAFVSAGYQKVFTTDEFDEKDATRLKNMGVEVTEVKESVSTWPLNGAPGVRIVHASYQQTPTPEGTAPATVTPATQPARKVITTDLPAGKYRATKMYRIALMADDHKWPSPKYMAWAAAFTELIGGAMLLIGLFSRLWGFGIACVMGVAFYMTTLQPPMEVHKHLQDFFSWSANPQYFSTLIVQLSLFAAAFGVMLTGPGPMSLDRALFGGGERRPPVPPPPPERPLRYDRAS